MGTLTVRTAKLWVRILLLIGFAFPLGACAQESPEPEFKRPTILEAPAAKKIPAGSYDLQLPSAGAALEIEVRLATEEDAESPDEVHPLKGFAIGSGLAGIGIGELLLIGPMAQGAALGGVILLPVLTYAGVAQANATKTLRKAVSGFDFLEHVRAGLAEARFGSAGEFPKDETAAPRHLEVIILDYGIFGDGALCFGLDARVSLKSGDREVFADEVIWGPDKRSEDLPPSLCATLFEFAEDEGQLASETLLEASQVLAAAIARRLGGRP